MSGASLLSRITPAPEYVAALHRDAEAGAKEANPNRRHRASRKGRRHSPAKHATEVTNDSTETVGRIDGMLERLRILKEEPTPQFTAQISSRAQPAEVSKPVAAEAVTDTNRPVQSVNVTTSLNGIETSPSKKQIDWADSDDDGDNSFTLNDWGITEAQLMAKSRTEPSLLAEVQPAINETPTPKPRTTAARPVSNRLSAQAISAIGKSDTTAIRDLNNSVKPTELFPNGTIASITKSAPTSDTEPVAPIQQSIEHSVVSERRRKPTDSGAFSRLSKGLLNTGTSPNKRAQITSNTSAVDSASGVKSDEASPQANLFKEKTAAAVEVPKPIAPTVSQPAAPSMQSGAASSRWAR